MASRQGRRWLWAGVVAVSLVLLAALAIQIVLLTDLPRRYVERSLAEETGLAVSIGSLRTGWGGRTTMREVRFRAPLDPPDRPLAVAPVLRATHANVLMLILGRPLGLSAVEAERPTVMLREGPTGEWNVVHAVELVRLAQDAMPDTGERAEWPRIEAKDATLVVERPGRDVLTLPLSARGGSEDGAWALEAASPGYIEARGRIVPGSLWAHKVEFRLERLPEMLRPWLDEPPDITLAAGRWTAEVRAGEVRGLLSLNEVRAAGAVASGPIRLSTAGDTVQIDPSGLRLSLREMPGGPVVVGPGAVRVGTRSGDVRSEGVVAEWNGVRAQLAGRWEAGEQRAEVMIGWAGTPAGIPVEEAGTLRATAELPRAGVRRINLSVESAGRMEAGSWTAAVSAHALGPSWDQLDGRVSADTLRWSPALGAPVDLAGLGAQWRLRGTVLRLMGLGLPGADEVDAQARFDWATREWEATLDVLRWIPPDTAGPWAAMGPVGVSLGASGDREHAKVSNLRIEARDATVEAHGDYRPRREQPLIADVVARLPAPTAGGDEGDDRASGFQRGSWRLGATVRGTLQPLGLDSEGALTAEGVRLADGELDALTIPVRGRIDPAVATVEVQRIHLLGGTLRAAARLPLSGTGEATAAAPPTATLVCDGVPLDRLARALGAPLSLSGRLHAEIDAAMPEFDPTQLAVDGNWTTGEFSSGDLRAQRGRGRIRGRGGAVELSDIELFTDHGSMRGRIDFNIEEWQRLRIAMTSDAWPVQVRDTTLGMLVDAEAALLVDLGEATASGRVAVKGPVAVAGAPLGHLDIDTMVEGRTIAASRITLRTADGRVEGKATVPLDRLLETTAELTMDGIDLATLAEPWAEPGDLTGALRGTLSVAPSQNPRSPEPLRAELRLSPTDAALRGIPLRGAVLTAYIGPDRAMLQDSIISVAGGHLETWARVTRHLDRPFFHAQLSFRDLSLNQIAHAAQPDLKPVPGVLAGQLAFGGFLNGPHRAFGDGTIRLRESDIVNLPVISTLYDLLNLGGPISRTGRGYATVRLEDKALDITTFRYFNRGTDVVGALRVEDIFRGPDSPIAGVAAATLRPLRGAALPFFPEADKMLTALQAGAAAVEIDGTLSERNVRPVGLDEVWMPVRALLQGGQR